MGGILLLYVY